MATNPRINIRISPVQKHFLEVEAKRLGLSVSGVVKQLIDSRKESLKNLGL